MKPLVVILLLAISVQAQSLADAARKERQRQAQLQTKRVIVSTENEAPQPADASKDNKDTKDAKAADVKPADGKPGDAKAGDAKAGDVSKDVSKPEAPPPPDPTKIWNDKMNELRTKIRALEDQETALRLQVGQLSNQLFAPVIDPDTQARVQNQLGQTQQQLATVRADLEVARKTLDTIVVQGPPAPPTTKSDPAARRAGEPR